jgi:signal peptidase I
VQFPGKRASLYVVASVLLLLLFAYFLLNYTRRVDGPSMLPTLEGGDLVVIQPVLTNDVHPGDIIVYGPPCSENGESVIHRVVGVAGGGGFLTQGDDRKTNPNTDQNLNIANSPITQACLIGKVLFIVPYIERLASLPYGLNYFVAALIFVVIIISELAGRRPPREAEPGAVAQSAVASVAVDPELSPSSQLVRIGIPIPGRVGPDTERCDSSTRHHS